LIQKKFNYRRKKMTLKEWDEFFNSELPVDHSIKKVAGEFAT